MSSRSGDLSHQVERNQAKLFIEAGESETNSAGIMF